MKTLQDAYNKICEHLLTMKEQSIGNLGCMYRDGQGNACAIGCLIEDKYYSKDLEEEPASDPNVMDAIRNSGYPCDFKAKIVYGCCQEIHDTTHLWDDDGLNPVGIQDLMEIGAYYELKIPESLTNAS